MSTPNIVWSIAASAFPTEPSLGALVCLYAVIIAAIGVGGLYIYKWSLSRTQKRVRHKAHSTPESKALAKGGEKPTNGQHNFRKSA